MTKLYGSLEEGAHGKSPKCLSGNLGDFGGILQRSQFLCAFSLFSVSEQSILYLENVVGRFVMAVYHSHMNN